MRRGDCVAEFRMMNGWGKGGRQKASGKLRAVGTTGRDRSRAVRALERHVDKRPRRATGILAGGNFQCKPRAGMPMPHCKGIGMAPGSSRSSSAGWTESTRIPVAGRLRVPKGCATGGIPGFAFGVACGGSGGGGGGGQRVLRWEMAADSDCAETQAVRKSLFSAFRHPAIHPPLWPTRTATEWRRS